MATDYTYHDEETMQKVYRSMRAIGLDHQQIMDTVHFIMNQGVLFREPLKPGTVVEFSPAVHSVYDMTFCLVSDCGHARYRHESKSDGGNAADGQGVCYVVGCGCMAGRYLPSAAKPMDKPDHADGHPYADEVSFSEFIRLLKGTKGSDWAILPDGDFRLLLHTFERKYKSALPLRQVDFTMFVFTVMRIMEEKGKPWIAVK